MRSKSYRQILLNGKPVPLRPKTLLKCESRQWEAFIIEHFEKRKGSYILLRSEQLVGAALIVVVKEEMTASIRSVEATTKKVHLLSAHIGMLLIGRLVFLG